MKHILISLFFIQFFQLSVFAQVVYTSPALPIENKTVTIFFDATKGTGGLKDFAGDVYAHTGVITDRSSSTSDWKYVKAGWTVNKPECKLTRVSTNLYKLDLAPSIREYYGVPASEKIQKIAIVFRSADSQKEGKDTGGKDIFVDVFTDQLEVSFTNPLTSASVYSTNSSVVVSASATQFSNLKLFINGTLATQATGTTIAQTVTYSSPIDLLAVVEATFESRTVRDTAWICIKGETQTATMPTGVRDGINYPSPTSATLVLYAPGKQNVFVLGDFNQWTPSNAFMMKKDGDRFWITINNLETNKKYAFQYLVDGTIRIADPYTELVLDPWNDKNIPASVFPQLPELSSRSEGIASVLDPGKTPFAWQTQNFVPDASNKLIIYEVLIRDFLATHDVKTLTDTLSYFKQLGINAIEIMPFNEFEGNESWGYNPSFYFATDKYYGRPADYKAFIDACHSNGIAVIMDMVLNHSYSQSPLVQLYFDNSTGKVTANNPWYNIISPNSVYSWGYDFNHESAATKQFVDRVVEFWLTEYKVDGFRFDFTKGFTNKPGDGQAYDESRITILKRIYDKMKSVNPNSLMICEHLADNNEEKVLSNYGILLWGNINYNYAQNIMGFASSSDISWASYKTRGWNNPNLISYMESHDEERVMYKALTWGNSTTGYNIKQLEVALKRDEAAAMLHILMPGPKMIWQFGELGYEISIDFNGRVGNKPLHWEYFDQPARNQLFQTYSILNWLKKNNQLFSTTDFTLNAGNQLVKWIKYSTADEKGIAVANFELNSQTIQPVFQQTGWYYECFSGDSVNITAVNQPITLNAGDYKLYSTKKFNVTNKVGFHNIKNHEFGNLSVYPNPAINRIVVEANSISKVEIFNLIGERMVFLSNESVNSKVELDVSKLQNGLYILRIFQQNGTFKLTKLIIAH